MKEVKFSVTKQMLHASVIECVKGIQENASTVANFFNDDKWYLEMYAKGMSQEEAALSYLEKVEINVKALRTAINSYFAVMTGEARLVLDHSLLDAQRKQDEITRPDYGFDAKGDLVKM